MPRLSIIIPCYNIELYISKCIESLLKQSFTDFELILLDDGSSDNTLQILEQYAVEDSRILVYSHKNQGVSFTRNVGLDLAHSPLIMFIDGDDYLKLDYLEKHLNAYVSGSWIISGFINIRNGTAIDNYDFKKLLVSSRESLQKTDYLQLLKYHSFSSPCCRIYEKNIIKDQSLRFDETMTYQEDLMFNLNYIKYVNSVKLIPYFGYYYIEHQVSSTGRFHKNFEYTETFFGKLMEMISSKEDQDIVDEFIFQTYMRRISNVFHLKSDKILKDKLEELNSIYNSIYYINFKRFLFKSKINIILKLVLSFKSPKLLLFYFKVLKK